jgi:hypothetical protein
MVMLGVARHKFPHPQGLWARCRAVINSDVCGIVAVAMTYLLLSDNSVNLLMIEPMIT